jgi:hypothetical protein
MTSVVEKQNVRTKSIYRVGRCLKGLVDGKTVFRFVDQQPRREVVKRRPADSWLAEGFYSGNLLDE